MFTPHFDVRASVVLNVFSSGENRDLFSLPPARLGHVRCGEFMMTTFRVQ